MWQPFLFWKITIVTFFFLSLHHTCRIVLYKPFSGIFNHLRSERHEDISACIYLRGRGRACMCERVRVRIRRFPPVCASLCLHVSNRCLGRRLACLPGNSRETVMVQNSAQGKSARRLLLVLSLSFRQGSWNKLAQFSYGPWWCRRCLLAARHHAKGPHQNDATLTIRHCKRRTVCVTMRRRYIYRKLNQYDRNSS